MNGKVFKRSSGDGENSVKPDLSQNEKRWGKDTMNETFLHDLSLPRVFSKPAPTAQAITLLMLLTDRLTSDATTTAV